MGLLDLPGNLRHLILQMVLLGEQSNSQVLLVCRQMHQEGEPLLYHRPQIFESQTQLFVWLATIGWEHLHEVNTLRLRLEDVNTSEAKEYSALTAGSTLRDDYEESWEQLDKSVHQLPEVKDFCLWKTTSTHNQKSYNILYGQALRNVAKWWPQLKYIAFQGCEHPISFVKAIQEIERLSFTGFSTSSPMETEAIFSRLRHLKEINIILPQHASNTNAAEQIDRSRSCLSLTRQVIKNIRGLKTFSICDTLNRPGDAPAFFTPDFLQALNASHRIFLRTFRVWLDFKPGDSAESAFHSLIASSSLHHLTAIWPGLDHQILRYLPKTLFTLRISLPDNQPLEFGLGMVLKTRETLKFLHEVVIIHQTKVCYDRFQLEQLHYSLSKAPITLEILDIGMSLYNAEVKAYLENVATVSDSPLTEDFLPSLRPRCEGSPIPLWRI